MREDDLPYVDPAQVPTRGCDHHYTYRGRATWPTGYPLPGTGAHGRIYADAYFCLKCCHLKLTNEQEIGNTYEKVRGDAVEYRSKPQ